MRRPLLIPALLLIGAVGTLHAQDPVKVAPGNFKVLLENERVRVLDFHSKSGEKIAMHSHPAYIAYGIAGAGKTTFTAPDGKVTADPAGAARATCRSAPPAPRCAPRSKPRCARCSSPADGPSCSGVTTPSPTR